MHRPGTEALARRVEAALAALEGVHWAEVNAVLGRVVVAFDDEALGVDDLVGVIEGVERAHEVHGEHFEGPDNPGDIETLHHSLLALGATVAGFVPAVLGAPLRATRLPGGVAAIVSVLESQPRLRRSLEGRVGRPRADVGLALTLAAAQGLAVGPVGLLVDCAHHAGKVLELSARRAAWERLEPRLCLGVGPATAPLEQPLTTASGTASDRAAELIGFASLVAAGVALAVTRSAGTTAGILAAGAPRAIRAGREGFAAGLGWRLAARDVIVLNRTVLRRLDDLDTVVIDTAGLPGDAADVEALTLRARNAGLDVVLGGKAKRLGPEALPSVAGGTRLSASIRRLAGEGRRIACVSAHNSAAVRAADCGIGLVCDGTAPPWGADLLCAGNLEVVGLIVDGAALARTATAAAVGLATVGSTLGALRGFAGLPGGAVRRALLPVNVAALFAQLTGLTLSVAFCRAGTAPRAESLV